jgi:hypothetical protein
MVVASPSEGSFKKRLVNAEVRIGGQQFKDMTVKEVILGESLLTPGLQTAVTLQSYVYSDVAKNLTAYKNQELEIEMSTQASQEDSENMYVNQKIYRIDNRSFSPLNTSKTEEFTIHACDQSLLNDAKSLVSKSWKCTTPDNIVEYALKSCAGASDPVIDSCSPARDYIAENIHPFQVVAQQCNVVLDGGDPSFLHYMTYENGGTHYFRSLKKLISGAGATQDRIFFHSEASRLDIAQRNIAIAFTFPSDFDLLSDLLNGIDENGNNINSVGAINPLTGTGNLFGAGSTDGCGVGSGNHKSAVSNKGSEQQQNSCNIDVEEWLLLRQARMGLLEKDKVAFRITAPWRPDIHVGQIIGLDWVNPKNGNPVYGHGNYLVASLTHNIQFGGFGTTTMDCIRRQY